MKKKILFGCKIVIFIGLAVAVLAYGVHSMHLREPLDYAENLDTVAVTVDGEDITLRDMYFYVLYEERVVEDAAVIYDESQTRRFWNVHTNSSFVQEEAKENIMGMAVHDAVFYRMARDWQMVLTSDEKATLEHRRDDFWADLYDVQWDTLPVSYDEINVAMKHAALAQKAQQRLTDETDGASYAGYNWDGADYKRMMQDHTVKINKKVWNRVIIGNVSLRHDTLISID
ncbi:MAG: hypothetical protein J6Z06_03295 [Lachnospiraceae bacterium]|nr:hypothetical protein [Lachnospiraceae bacterium]